MIDAAPSVDVEIERRRMRRWFWALGVLAVVGLVGLFRYDYPSVQTPAGTTYQVTFQGRYRGTDGAWTEFDYLTHSRSIDQTIAEVKELLPLAAELAGKQGDSLVRIAAIDRRFEFGLFHLDRTTILQFYRVGDTWRML